MTNKTDKIKSQLKFLKRKIPKCEKKISYLLEYYITV